MATKLQIINTAMIRLGEEPIVALDEDTRAAKIARGMWDISRAACLRDHPWNFAVTEAQLNSPYSELEVQEGAILEPSVFIAHEFRYVFQLPADCLRLLSVYHTPEYKKQGRLVMTNNPQCRVRYIRDVQDETEFDANFADVLASRLASDFGYAVTKSQSTADSNYQIYQQKLKMARHVDATEDTSGPLGGHYSDFIASRF